MPTRGALCASALALGLFAIAASGAAADTVVPQDSGLYVEVGDGIERLDGDEAFARATWDSRANLAPDASFLIHELGVAMTLADASRVSLRQVVRVRAHYAVDGTALPVEGDGWGVPDLAIFEIPMTLHTVDGRRDLIRASPQQPLAPGLYSLRYRDVSVLVGVDWPAVDQDAYAASHCAEVHQTTRGRVFIECGRIDAFGTAALDATN